MFIVFEGLDGAGKTTQVELLTERLRAAGRHVLQVHEPGGTPLGERVRALLKHEVSTPLSPTAELLLFAASRAQLVETVVRPALATGTVVIADRFTGSTYAYQGQGRGLAAETIHAVQAIACGGTAPDLTLLLDINHAVRAQRREGQDSGATADRFEDETTAFAGRVRAGYLALAAAPPPDSGRRWVVIAGDQPPADVAAEVWRAVSATLEGG